MNVCECVHVHVWKRYNLGGDSGQRCEGQLTSQDLESMKRSFSPIDACHDPDPCLCM